MALVGSIFIACEFSPKARREFSFLQLGYGKGLALIVLCPLLLVPLNFICTALAVWLFLCGLAFCIVSCVFRKEESVILNKLTELNPDDSPTRISVPAYDTIASILKAMSIFAVLLVGLDL